MPSLAELWGLQEIDSALDTRRASLDDARARIGDTEEIVALRARVEDLKAASRNAQSAQKDIELEADDLKSKIEPAEQKLYGGTVRNPRELSDLQADIAQLKQHLSAVEDRDLEALTASEKADNELREATAELESLEAAWREEQAELRERIDRLSAEIAIYERQRKEHAADIEPDLVKTYEHVRRAHQGRGVARLDRNLCLGCRISLPVSTVNRARAGAVVVQCPNCERILYA
ncbi:MAG: C4-type zinc ribbon domain-containing protein [Dehalococcoidia bacterium]